MPRQFTISELPNKHPLRDFLERHGKEVTTLVAQAAGTTYEYLEHIANGRNQPGVDLMWRIIRAAHAQTGEHLDASRMRPGRDKLRPMNCGVTAARRAAATTLPAEHDTPPEPSHP